MNGGSSDSPNGEWTMQSRLRWTASPDRASSSPYNHNRRLLPAHSSGRTLAWHSVHAPQLMTADLPNSQDVADAIRRYLQATAMEAPDAFAALNRATSAVASGKLNVWERTIRNELLAAQHGRSAGSWKFWEKPTRFASWLDLCNADGWKREAVLRAASGPAPNGLFLAFAIRRLNDWVPQVRAAARENLLRMATASDPQHVADALWAQLPHCSSWGRLDGSDLHVLTELIALKGPSRALHDRLLTATAGPGPVVLAQAARTAALDSWLEETASLAVQPAVRATAFRFLFERRASWSVGREWKWIDLKWCIGRLEPVLQTRELTVRSDVYKLLQLALNDASAMVRRVGADALVGNLASLRESAIVLAEQFATDRNASVAERGQYAVAKLKERSADLHD